MICFFVHYLQCVVDYVKIDDSSFNSYIFVKPN